MNRFPSRDVAAALVVWQFAGATDRGARVVERGWLVEGWTVPQRPGAIVLEGAAVRLEPLAAGHAPALYAANVVDDRIWDYLPYGPFGTEAEYTAWLAHVVGKDDPRFFALVDRATGLAGGVASYLRVTPEAGSIEVGHICLSRGMQKTRAATEAIWLMADWAFGHGYRRFEWKCDALNGPSRRAAQRYGFSYEGIFRQASVVKGRNRDTAWFAMVDRDWPCLKAAFGRWLGDANFDAAGRQVEALGALTAPCRVASDPGL